MKIWGAIFLFGLASFCFGVETNHYHFEREFEELPYDASSPTLYKILVGADQLTGIVGGITNIQPMTGSTYAVEYEGTAWGYTNSTSAWNRAVSVYGYSSSNYPNTYFTNAGWVLGTRQVYDDTWSAFVYYLKNVIKFQSSTSSVYITPNGTTSTIASVLVGTLGDYCPQTTVTDTGPTLPTTFMGDGVDTNISLAPDLTVYYKLQPNSYRSVNDDDSDDDDIPDFADGYDWNGVSGDSDDISSNDLFTTWNLLLSGYADPTAALVRITYDSSSPLDVITNESGYTAASGTFRIWTTNAPKVRNANAVTNGGNYVPSATFAATNLGFSASRRQVKLYIECVNPAEAEEITMEVDPDGNGSKSFVCVEKLRCTVFDFEFITPAGDPVNVPSDSGDGQNEFTFSSNYPGTLAMNLKAQVSPTGIASQLADQTYFIVGTIGNSLMTWDAANPGGRSFATGDYLTATVVFSNLPPYNSNFGSKTAAVEYFGFTMATQTYEVFFPKWATNYPGASSTEPNWFYFWKDGQVCGIDSNCAYDGTADFGYTYPGVDSIVRLGPYAPEVNTGPEIYNSGTTNYGSVTVTGQGQGIQCVAETIQHERHHLEIYNNFYALIVAAHTNGGAYNGDPYDDPDAEKVPNVEEPTLDGLNSDPNDPDTYIMGGGYTSYGDNEIRCRKHELNLTIQIYPTNDWANPGCQSKIKVGP